MLQQGKVALPCNYLIDFDDTEGIDFDQSPADVAVFPIPFKCTVAYAAIMVTEVCAGSSTTPVVAFDKRPTAGDDTDRGDGDIGNIALGTSAPGVFMYDLAGIKEVLEPGEEVVVQLVTAAAGTPTGHGRPVLVVHPRDEMWENLDNAVETA